MAFDRTDPADLLALQVEVLTDPTAMGYDPAGSTPQLLALFNDPENNPLRQGGTVGGESATRDFDPSAILDALEPTEFGSQQAEVNAAEYTAMLVAYGSSAGSITPYKTKWRSMFPANGLTVAALDAQNVLLSRMEVLFGQFTVISRDDWFAARDYVA